MARRKKLSNNLKEIISTLVIILSTAVIIFNNAGQSLQLLSLNITKTAYYWIAGICLGMGIIWEAYLNKILRI